MFVNIYFSCQINLTIGERQNKKNIDSLLVTRNIILFFYSQKHLFTRLLIKKQQLKTLKG